MLTYQKRHDYELTVDDERVALSLSRPDTTAEWRAFKRGFMRMNTPPQGRMMERKPDEQETKEDGSGFAIPTAEILVRRVAELSPEEKAAYDREVDAYEAWACDWIADVVTRYAQIKPGQLAVVDNEGVETETTDPRFLVQLLAARPEILQQVAYEIWTETALSEKVKNALRSPSTSSTSSPAPPPEAPGPTRETTVDDAEREDFVEAGAATDPAPGPSSPTAAAT